MEEAVRRALDDKVRPAIKLDGGDLELVKVEDGTVTVRMFGACECCPMSPVTLRMAIERILRDEIPGIQEVIATE